MDIWLEILIIFLASTVVLYVVARILGYRLIRKRRPKAVSDSGSLEAERASSRAMGRAAMSALSEIQDGVVITNSSLLVQYVNDAALRMFGLSADTHSGQTFIEVVRNHECNSLLRTCISTNRVQASVIETHLNRQVLDVAATPDKETGNYIVIIRDLTERRRMEKVRRDLVSNIAHEFRTPIASIRLLTETLLHGKTTDPKVREDFLRKIDFESGRLEQMTNDLRELSLLDRGGPVIDKSAVDIGRLIEQAVERLKAQADRKQIVIETDVESGLPRPFIDRAGIESVLMNLLYNAIKYSDEGGRVEIKGAKDGNAILISVKDHGIGIPDDELPRIFERFYKVDRSRNTEGSGLGLAISKHIIALHGGRIWAESVERKGSTFYFTLPLPA